MLGIYLGQSYEHASNVAYVSNTRTYHISLQYHIIYDDEFATSSAHTELQEVNLWQGLNKIQPKLGLVNQLPNQDKFDFKRKNVKVNVMDLLDTDSRGLVHTVPLERYLDNPRAQKNRKTKMSNPQPRVTKDCNLKDNSTDVVDT